MSYGSLPQGQKGRTLSPLRLETAGMTLSEQTKNTTSNTPHEVRRSDSLFPPPPPVFRVVRFHLCFLRFGACFSFAPPGVGWGPFCSGRDLSHGSSASCMSFIARSIFCLVSFAVFCPLCGFASPVGLRPFGLLFFLSVASVLRLLVFAVSVVLLFGFGRALLFSRLVIGTCWLLSLSVVSSPPPAVGPVWRPGPVFTLVPPSGYLVAAVTAQLPCRSAGSVGVLCRPSFILSHGSKGS